jgi:hypothetical protein
LQSEGKGRLSFWKPGVDANLDLSSPGRFFLPPERSGATSSGSESTNIHQANVPKGYSIYQIFADA